MNLFEVYNQKWKKHIQMQRLRHLIHTPKEVYRFLYHLTIESVVSWSEKSYVYIGSKKMDIYYQSFEIIVCYQGEDYCFYKRYCSETPYCHKNQWNVTSLSTLAPLTSEQRKSIRKVISEFPFHELFERDLPHIKYPNYLS